MFINCNTDNYLYFIVTKFGKKLLKKQKTLLTIIKLKTSYIFQILVTYERKYVNHIMYCN